MGYFVGLDVSLLQTALCVVDHDGKMTREGMAETEPAALGVWLRATDLAFERIGPEAGPVLFMAA